MQQTYKDALTKAISDAGITDKSTIAMIFAQCHYESENFSVFEENLHYRPVGLLNTFPKYVTSIQMANNLVNGGVKVIANCVYANRMGNGDSNSGDGWNYRGRGMIQLTGKDNYAAATLELDIDVLTNPDLASTPDVAAKIAVAFFTRRPNLIQHAQDGECDACTKIINGGLNGAPERQALYAEYMKELAA